MSGKNQAVEKMNLYANELVKMMVKDGGKMKEAELKIAFENVARAMIDMTNIHLNREKDVNEALKTSLSRMKIARNCVYATKNTPLIQKGNTKTISN
ncbi:hypothetical protein FIU87_07890 [Bacillus sp. THAF10]|uniref:hypothetical protein n=1 Tax=Bacillus sp. THAF10 TaxID=2587848 RepID=UPI001268C7D4|nr:hypothetical protein [Bacillus sp. THAF10]QFT88559.1 hypothetical protein FIU87_07890 [Bacillus sp. THAF10]